jgi:hypothetical protein
MNDFVCFYFEGMTFNLSEGIWLRSGRQIPDWALHFLIDVLAEGFSIVGISGKAMEKFET